MKSYLILRLDAPFQSYSMGRTERYIKTSLFPTKSAIIGLLGCALGYSRGDERLIILCDNLKMAVRIDSYPINLVDYQTIHGGNIYAQDSKTGQWVRKEKSGHLTIESVLQNKEATASGDSAKIVKKEYLMDAIFTVVLEGEEKILKECVDALNNPIWFYSLGRSNCIPSIPLIGNKREEPIQNFESLEEAIQKVPILRRRKNMNEEDFLYEMEVNFDERVNYPIETVREYFDLTNTFVAYDYRKRYVVRNSFKLPN